MDKQYYYCKRLRLLEFLINKGFNPIRTQPDIRNPSYKVWVFDKTEELDKALNYYFEVQIKH